MNQIDDSSIAKATVLRCYLLRRFADGAAQPILSFFVVRLTELSNFKIDCGLFGHGNCTRGFGDDVPAGGFALFQIEIDARYVTGPTIGLRQQHTVDHQRRHVPVRVTH